MCINIYLSSVTTVWTWPWEPMQENSPGASLLLTLTILLIPDVWQLSPQQAIASTIMPEEMKKQEIKE